MQPQASGASRAPEDVAVGRIGKPHGVRGAVFVQPWTDSPDERFAVGRRVRTEPPERGPLVVRDSRNHSGRLVVEFEGVEDRNGAEALRDIVLVVSTAERPPIDDPDEFYDTDLVGLTALDPAGGRLGVVADVLHSAGGSVLALDQGGREFLVPFRKELVPVVDLAAGTLVVDPPPGLFEL
jgi:16S rRNA processing protein RimM